MYNGFIILLSVDIQTEEEQQQKQNRFNSIHSDKITAAKIAKKKDTVGTKVRRHAMRAAENKKE